VSIIQEVVHMTNLRVEVALADLWPELHFFNGDVAGLLARFLLLLSLFVPELAVIHDSAHWRISQWCDLNKIEIEFPCESQGIGCRANSDLTSIGTDDTNLARSDALVVAGFARRRCYGCLLVCNGLRPPSLRRPHARSRRHDTTEGRARSLDLAHVAENPHESGKVGAIGSGSFETKDVAPLRMYGDQ